MSLDALRFAFVTGKGGVGKTTVAAAIATAFAARGKKVLIAMSGAHERLSAMMQTPPIGHELVQLGERIWATRIDPERALEEYGEMVLKVKALARVVFENKYTNGFFRAVPGMHDWALLGKAWWHTTEEEDGAPRFDLVLFDAPSTGHGLDMLRVPRVILDIVPPGVLRRDAERAWQLFRDPARAGVVVVSQAEDMPVTETVELVTALRGELKLPLALVVVNALLPPIFSEAERDALAADENLLDPARSVSSRAGPPRTAVEVSLAAAARRAAREQIQARNLARLKHDLGVEPVVLPFLLENGGTPAAIRRLAEHF